MGGVRLSQNFLHDPTILKRIVRVAGVGPDDTVVEIGPGYGKLTRLLAERARRVMAIELDRGLFEKLASGLSGIPNVEVHLGDALRFNYGALGPFKVVANIPYHITTPIIFKLLQYRRSLSSMTLTVQKEVAQRITAGPGTRHYGVLSVAVQYHCRAELKFVIPRGAFRPVPRVDSACIHMEVCERPSVAVADEEMFFNIVRTSFGQRRKTLHNSLKTLLPDVDGVLRASGIDPGRRPETLSIEDFARIADEVVSYA